MTPNSIDPNLNLISIIILQLKFGKEPFRSKVKSNDDHNNV